MAIKLGALKLFGGGKAPAAQAPAGKPAAPARGGFLAWRLPLLGSMRTGKQLQILTTVLVLLLLADAAIVFVDARQGTFGTVYIATVGKIRMLSQRLAKAAQQASQGNKEAFKQLRQSRNEFDASMKLLSGGGLASGAVDLPATASAARPGLHALDTEWAKT